MTNYDSLLEMLQAFPNEAACVAHLEKLRWPAGKICPLCGCAGKIYSRKRVGVYKCSDCGDEFSIRKGTIYEESRLSLRKWFMAAWLVTSNRKGISSYQLAREVGVSQKTAWFMLGRLRKSAETALEKSPPMDGEVEADETYLGGKEKNKHNSKKAKAGRGPVGKDVAIGVRSREGNVFAQKISHTDRDTMVGFIEDNVLLGSTIYTDDHRSYRGLGEFYDHEFVIHSVGEYVRDKAHTNGIESFWSMLKRGYNGVFHQFSWKHLNRYLSEFAFRWNLNGSTGGQRMDSMLESGFGSRLTYKALIA